MQWIEKEQEEIGDEGCRIKIEKRGEGGEREEGVHTERHAPHRPHDLLQHKSTNNEPPPIAPAHIHPDHNSSLSNIRSHPQESRQGEVLLAPSMKRVPERQPWMAWLLRMDTSPEWRRRGK
jgi:hypothetical protein